MHMNYMEIQKETRFLFLSVSMSRDWHELKETPLYSLQSSATKKLDICQIFVKLKAFTPIRNQLFMNDMVVLSLAQPIMKSNALRGISFLA